MNTFKKISSLFVIAILLFSCSSNDGNGNGNGDGNGDGNEPNTNYNLIPFTNGNNWVYDVVTLDQDGVTELSSSTDTVTLDGTVDINNMTYQDFSASVGSTGFMSGMFDRNNFRDNDGIYYMKGDFTVPLSDLGGTDIVVNIDDAKLIDQSKNDGDQLSSQSGSTSQTIQSITMDINYTFKTEQNETLATYTVNNTSYTNVVASSIIINASGTMPVTVGPITQDIGILPSQDIYVIKNYYAEDIGLIDSEAIFSYQLLDVSQYGVTLPIPSTGGNTTTQKINSYTIN